ncbi:MAG: hypothetical protein IJY22_06130 [Clostridia bacterium]|nr:hypothetical protein [Clostridia bacterium]
MQKIMKNWIFTMVTAIVLFLLALFMILDGAGVADRFVTQSIIHEITAIFVACYVILVLCPMVPRYQPLVRYFALGEIGLLSLTVLLIFLNTMVGIRWIENMVVCSVVGLVIWLRSVVELVGAYLIPTDCEKRLPLWRICVYILTAALGVWQMANPLIGNRYLIFPVAALTLLLCAGLVVLTVRNRRALPPKVPKADKEQGDASEQETQATTDGGESAENA